jgi:hypothetical protein
MKAISIKQPWAWLIVNGFKDIENRTWKTYHRGRVFIHASKRPDNTPGLRERLESMIGRRIPDALDTGGVVGEAEITDCVGSSDSPWFSGPFGFVLKNQKPLPLAPCNGQLFFFTPRI